MDYIDIITEFLNGTWTGDGYVDPPALGFCTSRSTSRSCYIIYNEPFEKCIRVTRVLGKIDIQDNGDLYITSIGVTRTLEYIGNMHDPCTLPKFLHEFIGISRLNAPDNEVRYKYKRPETFWRWLISLFKWW